MIRAADVVLKERRRLILMVRESPFHLGHLRTMTLLSEMGAIVAPPIPGFYNRPSTIEDLVDSSVDRVLDLLGVPDDSIRRWAGPERAAAAQRSTNEDETKGEGEL
jgi:4-hydroxy-3-polyprenylbenzoate decarboxylase